MLAATDIGPSWPSATVAIALMLSVTAIVIAAIMRYGLEGANKVMGVARPACRPRFRLIRRIFLRRPATVKARPQLTDSQNAIESAYESVSEAQELVQRTNLPRLTTLSTATLASMGGNGIPAATQPVHWQADITARSEHINNSEAKLGAMRAANR